LRESGSEVFFGDFWFKYAIIFVRPEERRQTLEHDGFCFDLLAIDALIGVIVRANRRALQ